MALSGAISIMLTADVKDFRETIKEAAAQLQELTGVSKETAFGIVKLEARLKDQIATFGMAAHEAQIHRLALQGVSDAALGSVRALSKQLTALENAEKAEKELEKAEKEAAKASQDRWSTTTSTIKTAGLAILGAGLAAAGGLAALTTSSMKSIDATGDVAGRLGIASDSLATLRYAAQLSGSETEALDASLAKMNINLGEAASKGGPAEEALNNIGLKSKDLAKLDPGEAFKQIAGGFEKIPTASGKATTAMALFGKGGVGLINTLSAGRDEIEKLQAEAKSFGVGVSDADTAKVGAANDAIDKLGIALSGVGNILAVKVAPIISSGIEEFLKWANSGSNATGIIDGGMTALRKSLTFVADSVHYVGVGFQAAQLGVETFATVGVTAIWGLVKALETVVNILPGVDASFAEGLGSISESMGMSLEKHAVELRKAWDSPPPSAGLNKFFDDVTSKANSSESAVKGVSNAFLDLAGKISTFSDKLNESIKTFGMSGDEIEIWKLKEAGATEEVLKGVRAQQSQLEALRRNAKEVDAYQEKAKSVYESTLTPLEKYTKELKELDKLRAGGALDDKTYAKAKGNLGRDLFQTDQYKGVGALEANSAEARSSILSYNATSRGNGINEIAQKSLDESREQTSLLRKIAGNYNRQSVVTID